MRGGAQSSRANWLLDTGVVIVLVVVIAQIGAQLVDFGIYHLRVGWLNSNRHASVFGAASLAAQGSVAVAAAIRSGAPPRRVTWGLIAILVGILLVVRLSVPYSAPLLIGPVAVVFVLLWRSTREEPERVRRMIRTGLWLLLVSFAVHAVGPAVVSALTDGGTGSWPYQLKGLMKHSAELAGWMLVATGVIAIACSTPVRTAVPIRSRLIRRESKA